MARWLVFTHLCSLQKLSTGFLEHEKTVRDDCPERIICNIKFKEQIIVQTRLRDPRGIYYPFNDGSTRACCGCAMSGRSHKMR